MTGDSTTDEGPPLGTRLRGGYELVRFIGAGGMGVVYEAVSQSGRHVAIKVLLPEILKAFGSEPQKRFDREARIASGFDTPHIVRVLDAGIDPVLRLPFMVMPLLVGLDLQELLVRLGPIHPTVAVRIVRQACVGLVAAHARGVVHRDIKPANLFLDHDRQGKVTVRLFDFGVAKWRRQDVALTRTGSLLGTPDYMSPEQISSPKSVDERSDVWSLALTLYEALADTPPFGGRSSMAEICLAVVSGEVPPLQEVAPWVEPALAAAVHGAALRDREARCPSARELADALRPFAGGADELSAQMLVGVPEEIRSQRAPRAVLPASWAEAPLAVAAPTAPAPVADVPDPMLGKIVGGRYALLRCLGRGGMGAVYEAERSDGQHFAVKIIDPEVAGRDRTLPGRMAREAQAAASIDNEHVVRVVEVGTHGADFPFIAMELLHGFDLAVLIKRHGALRPETAARLFMQACRGLEAAHARGFVHRDIKPGNLFLCLTRCGQVHVKICDFGVVKRLEHDRQERRSAALTRTGGVVGSPMYMSPEQAKNAKNIDRRADIWSLGASLFEALCGTPPWQGRESVGELIVAICTEPVPDVRERAPWAPAELAAVVSRAMQRAAEQRYGSAMELEQALAAWAGAAPLLVPEDLAPARGLSEALASAATVVSERGSPLARSVTPAPAVPSRSRRALVLGAAGTVAALALVAAVALVAGAQGRRPLAGEPAGTATAAADAGGDGRRAGEVPGRDAAAPGATPAGPREVRIRVEPASARVFVDGEPRELHDGQVGLRGHPGDRFTVVVVAGAQRIEQPVIIGDDGRASPATLDLSAAPSGRPPRPAGAPRAAASAAATPAPGTTATAGSRTTAAPPSARPPSARDKWD
ncbi:MAG: serine/threonine protein kinase [Deltaproteobacteria bacterium]|nr:serine/threonine protein kinase [Deltaproteobacteria bacterium]